MAIANIVHSGYGFRCTATDTALPSRPNASGRVRSVAVQ